MRIAVDDREIATRIVARPQARARSEHAFKEVAALARQPVTRAIGELCELDSKTARVLFSNVCLVPPAHCVAEPRIIPPRGVECGPSS